MNYFEACKFCELVKKYNNDKLKFFLGSPVKYMVLYLGDKRKPLFNIGTTQLKMYQDINYKISAFGEDGWDVMAYASSQVVIKLDNGQEFKRFPACYLNSLYYDTTLTDTEFCIKAMQRFLDVNDLELFWNEIYKEGISLLV